MDSERRSAWSRVWKVVAALCALAVLGTVVAIAWLWIESRRPVPAVRIPTPVMPVPNAYDYYVAATKMIKDANKIGFAGANTKQPVAPSGPEDKLYSLAEKEALVRANAQALKLFRQGLSYQYQSPPIRSLADQNARSPVMAKVRNLARLLSLEAETKAQRGDWGGAMSSRLDVIRLGQDIPRGGGIIDMLGGIAVQAIARADAWGAVDHLNAKEARAAAARIEDIMSRRVPFADVLTEEKWMGIAVQIDLGSGRAKLTGTGGASLPRAPRWMLGRMVRSYASYMDRFIANCRLPYAAKAPPPPKPSVLNQMLTLGGSTVATMLVPVFEHARSAYVHRCETQNALLTAALALRAYRLEHGSCPANLADLVPKYLKKIPDDPFAMKGPLKYRLTGQKYVLYSIGPDGKDDGGRPVFHSTQPPDRRYRVEESDKGDIVAGVNLY